MEFERYGTLLDVFINIVTELEWKYAAMIRVDITVKDNGWEHFYNKNFKPHNRQSDINLT